ncbi:MAG: permease [Clostridiales bacterium 38-18]|nr:MAG: permease [Clostridiales bacterium 38-18]
MTTSIFYIVVGILTIISFIKDKTKTKKALKIGFNSFRKLLPSIIPMMIGIGLILSILSPNTVSQLLGEKSGILGAITAMVIGSIAFMPSFVAFPLGANLLSHGAGFPQIAGFISSLMAVGVVSLGLEIKYFGKMTAILRNITALTASIVFVLLVWRLM